MKGRFDSSKNMQFKKNIWFRVEVGFKRAIHTGFSYAFRLHLCYIESVSYSQYNGLIYLNKSILPPFQLSFVAARILSFLC